MSDVGEAESATLGGGTFHRLTVKAVREETAEARSFVLAPAAREAALYRYRPGQFLTFRIPLPAGEILRSYSLSSAPCSDPDLCVCVKRVAEGRGSNWINDHLTAGASILASRPAGRFVLGEGESEVGRPLLLIAGGSGITPCISLVKQALFESDRAVKLVYANRDAASVIYRESLDLLQERFAGRFACQHWLDAERGFLTAADIALAAQGWEASDCYICGPEPLMTLAEDRLEGLLSPQSRILTERFVSPDDPEAEAPTPAPRASGITTFRLTLDEEEHVVPITAGQTLLQAAIAAGIDVPSSCIQGHCGTCMAHLKSGQVAMASTKALSKRNIERGHVLACQARPSADEPVWLDFDF